MIPLWPRRHLQALAGRQAGGFVQQHLAGRGQVLGVRHARQRRAEQQQLVALAPAQAGQQQPAAAQPHLHAQIEHALGGLQPLEAAHGLLHGVSCLAGAQSGLLAAEAYQQRVAAELEQVALVAGNDRQHGGEIIVDDGGDDLGPLAAQLGQPL